MKPSSGGGILFIGSGPYRLSQEIRGNVFAHSCLSYMAEKGLSATVMDNDGAGTLSREGAGGFIRKPMDAEGISEALFEVKPSVVWPVCAGKEIQGLVARVLEESGEGGLLPGGLRPWTAATDWRVFRKVAEAAGVETPFGKVARSIEEAATVAREVGFPVFLSASRARGGGGARIVYNHEELAAQMGRLLGWSLAGEVLVVRVYEKHAQCQVHVLRDAGGRVKVLGIVDILGPLGVHASNLTMAYPGKSLGEELRGEIGRQAEALAEGAGLAGYGCFHFGVGEGAKPYAVGMSAGFSASGYILSLGLGLDLGRAASAAALGETSEEATGGAGEGALTVVSTPRFDSELFEGAGDTLGPHKVSAGRGVGIAEGFEEAYLAAVRSARSGKEGLFEEAFEKAGGPDALGMIAGCRTDFAAEVIASILQGHTLEEVAGASGVSRHYLERLAGLVRIYRDLKRSGGGEGKEAKEALAAGFSAEEVGGATGGGAVSTAAASGRIIRGGKGGGKAFVVFGPPAKGVGGVDESDVVLAGLCRAYAGKGYKTVFAGWPSQMPLDLFFEAGEVRAYAGGGNAEGILGRGAEGIAYVDFRREDWGELAEAVRAAGWRLAGVAPEKEAALADRRQLGGMMSSAGLVLKEGEEVSNEERAVKVAGGYGYPVLFKPRDGRCGDMVAYDAGQLGGQIERCGGGVVERFIEDIAECAVVVISDGESARAAAVVEVLEEAGIWSVDCAGVLPPFAIPERTVQSLSRKAEAFVAGTGIRGIVTVRLGVRYDVTYYLSATARGAREIPFAAMAAGEDIVSAAAEIYEGATIGEVLPERRGRKKGVLVRQPVFSFDRFPGADTVLGTLGRSTGDVVGEGANFSQAFANAMRAAGRALPEGGRVFVSLRDRDKREGMALGRELKRAGFKIVATEGTAKVLSAAGVEARVVYRVSEGRPNVVDLIKNHEISMVIYTPAGRVPREDEVGIRTVAWGMGIPVITTIGEARAAVGAIEGMRG